MVYNHDSRPIYGPWRIYTSEEEHEMILASLKRENDFNRNWYERKDSVNHSRAMNALDREIVDRNL